MVTIAVVHFTFIIIYQIITYTCGGVMRCWVEKITVSTKTKLSMLFYQRQGYYDSEEGIQAPNKVCYIKMRKPLVNFDS